MSQFTFKWVTTREGKFTDVLDGIQGTSSRIPGHLKPTDAMAMLERAREIMAGAA